MKEKNQKDITPVFALTALSVVLAILTIFSFVMMKEEVNKRIATEKAYYQISDEIPEVFEYLIEEAKSTKAELKDLKKQIDLLQSAIVEKQESFFEDYNFYLLVVVSRERTKTDFVWTYGLQMLDDNSDTAYVDSDKLFSIGEHIVAIELNDNSVILRKF